jgi:tetratricopeptide (TPR) repeat protein
MWHGESKPRARMARRPNPLTVLPLLALQACLPSRALHPRGAEQLERGYAHLAAGDLERAEVAFEHALEFAPDLPEGWNGLGVVARARDDLDLAHRRFARAVRLAPQFAEGLANLGEALLALGREDEAAEALRAALAIDPDLPGARLNLARALLRRGLSDPPRRERLWTKARREYLHLLEAAPARAEAHRDLAFMDYLSGRFARAEASWRAALAAAPSPEAFHGLFLALVRQGRCDEARAACDRCLATRPGDERCRASRRGAMACATVECRVRCPRMERPAPRWRDRPR